jgi:hypothetical protein
MGKPDALSRRANHRPGQGDNDNLMLLTPELFWIHTLAGVKLEGDEHNVSLRGSAQSQRRRARGISGEGSQGASEGQGQRHGQERRVV